jgi:ABC-type lipoprotein release transport system permease subunit
MSHDPMTAFQFRWFLTLVTGGVSAIWFLSDARKLWKARTAGSDPAVRDRRFGYVMGLIIATIGMVGSAKLQGWISWGSSPAAPAATVQAEPRNASQDFTGGLFVVASAQADLATVVATAIGIGPDVKGANMRVDSEGMIHHGDDLTPLKLVGLTPNRMRELTKYIAYGAMTTDTASDPTIEIGTILADRLGVKVGDSLDVEIAQTHHSIRIAAIHKIAVGDLDFTGFMNLATAQALVGAKARTSVEIALANSDSDHRVAKQLQDKLGVAHKVIDWCQFDHHMICH